MNALLRASADARRAVSLLSVVPAGRWERDDVGPATAGWFPAVGLALGAVGFALVAAVRTLGWQGGASLVVAALVVAAWAAFSRMLHWDGLADVADGLLGGSTSARRLEIMHDSANGSFATVAVALVLIVQCAALAAVVDSGHEMVLIAVPACARLSATFAAWLGSPASPGGLGSSVMGRPGPLSVLNAAIWTGGAVLATFAILSGPVAWGVLGVVLAAALVVPHVLSGFVGGVTGDIMGASIVLVETIFLAALALTGGA